MVRVTKEAARLFATHLLEDAMLYADEHQDEYNAFITSTGDGTQKRADTQNDEPLYEQQAAV